MKRTWWGSVVMTRHSVRMPSRKKRTAFSSGPVGDAGRGEDDVPAGRQVLGPVDAVEVGDAHLAQAVGVGGPRQDEPALDLAVEAAHGGGGEHALRGARRCP